MPERTPEERKREHHLASAILDTVGALIVVLDQEGRIVRFNRACEEMTGYTAAEVTGKQVWELFLPPKEAESVRATFDHLRSGHFPNEHTNFWLTKSGSQRLISWSNTALLDDQGQIEYIIGTGIDVTERKEAERKTQSYVAQLEAIREVGLDLVAELNLADLLRSIVSRAVILMNGDAGGLYLYSAEHDLLKWTTAIGEGLAPIGTTLQRGEGLSGRVWERGEPLIVNDYEHWAGRAAVYEGFQFESTIGVPICWGDEFLGVLNVLRWTPGTFSSDDADLLSLLATQAAIAIKNARLFQSEREQRELTRALQEATAAVSSTLELDRVLDRILDQMKRVIPCDTSNVMLIEGDTARVVRWHGYDQFGGGDHLDDIAFRVSQTQNLAEMYQSGQPALVPDTRAYEAWIRISDWILSYAGAPIHVRDRCIGFLNVNSTTPGFFTETHLDHLRAFANQAGLAIQNAQMYEETRRRLEHLTALHQTGLTITSDLDLDGVLENLYHEIERIMDAGAFYVALHDAKTGLIHFPLLTGKDGPVEIAPLDLDRNSGITGYVLQTGQPLYVADIQAGMAAKETPFDIIPLADMPTHSYIGVPLAVRDRIIGVLSVQSYRTDAYTQADVELLTTIAAQATIAIENARMYDEARQRNRELTLLNRIIAASAASHEIEAILERTCRELALAFDVPQAAAALFNEAQTEAVVVAEYRAPGRPSALNAVIPVEGNPAFQQLIEDRKPLVIENAQADPRQASIYDLMRRRGTVSLLLLPLVIEGKVVGGLDLEALQPRVFSEQEVALAQRVAEQVSGAMARARLEDTQRRLGTAVEQAAESIVITNTEATIIHVNPAFERITGYRYDKVVGQSPRILQSNDQDEKFYKDLWDTLCAGEAWQGRLVNRRKDGSLLVQDATITPVRNQAGNVVNYVATMRDVTREVELEEQFRQAQKLEALGRLAGGVAHDFNNLLTIIHISSRLLERKLHPEDPLQEHVERIADAGDHATQLNKQLLSFSRRQVIEPQVIQVNEAVQDLSRMLQRIIGEDIQLELALSQDLWTVNVDPSQLDQVIMNLVVNARDAMPEGGTLTLRTANTVLDAAYAARHMEAQPGEYALLSIRDTGVGMDDEIKSHLFEPFFTTKEGEKGTGLGLATVFGIVKQSGGHIEVESEVGRGATFRIYLPRARHTASQAPDERPPGSPEGTETILLVEDETLVRDLARQILTMHGYQVLVAENGQDALQVSASHQGPVHLLLTDVIMPHMGGRELAEKMRTQRPETRVLYMSGHADEALARHGVSQEGAAFVAKPLTLESLVEAVRTALDRR